MNRELGYPPITALILRTALEKGLTAAVIYKALIDVGYTNQEMSEGFLLLLEEVEPCP